MQKMVAFSLGALLGCFLFVEKNNVNNEHANAKAP
jgi:hypothetical protein